MKQSEERYRELFENANDILFTHDLGLNLTSVNKAAEVLTGFTRGELLGRNLKTLLSSRDFDVATAAIATLDRGPATYQIEIATKGGGRVPLEASVRLLREKGRPSEVQGIARDITERRLAEQARRKTEEHFRMLIENASDIITIIDRNGTIQYESPSIKRSLGWEPNELVGTNAFEHVHPDDLTRVVDAFERTDRPDATASVEFRFRHKDGTWRTLEAIGNSIGGEFEFDGVVVNSRDVTERKRAEEEQQRLQQAIQKSAAEWRLTFDAVSSPVLVLDPQGRIERLNHAARELLGGGYGELCSQHLAGLATREPWLKATELARLIVEMHTAISAQAWDRESGRTWDVAASFAAGVSREEDHVILVAREITDMVKLQESLRRSEIMSAMGSLVAGVAHEVRNPLFGISATLDAFESRFGVKEDHQHHIKILRGEVARLSHLMQELLEYGRPPSSNLRAGSVEFITNQAVNQCRLLAGERQVKVENRVISRQFGPVAMDATRLIQVFSNLIENAIHHSQPGDTVTLDAEEVVDKGGKWIHFTVRDEGPGFAEEDLTSAFEPFYTRRRGGTGLGLSIVQRIVDEHHGRITAGNHPEGGALLQVWLPVAQ